MSQPFIVVGDKIDHGGVVVSGTVTTDINGLPVARINDKVSCSQHGATVIASGDPTVIIDGQPVARHGDKTACGATLISGMQAQVFIDTGGGGGGGGGTSRVASAIGAHAANAANQAMSAGSAGGESETSRLVEVGRGKASARGGWRVADVLKQLCPQDKAVVDEMAQAEITVSDEIYFDDLRYDGQKWITEWFQAGGTQSGGTIGLLSATTPNDATTTIYHETWHKSQPDSMSWVDKEIEAYYETEQWTIRRGLRGQQDGLRIRDSAGNPVANKDAISEYVRSKYPVSPDATKPYPTRLDDAGNVELSDGSYRPPQRGDRISGSETARNKRSIPSSVWKCPGESAVDEEAERGDR